MSVRIFGQHDEATVAQIHRCMAVGGTRAVLCADGHKGYAQPIGGVIAYRDLVSISGVGFDIACGNLAISTDATGAAIRPNIAQIMDEIVHTISFGMGRRSKERVDHELFGDPLWTEQPFHQLKDIARNQLGTVGSGNHYVDIFTDEVDRVWVGVHFGSRGLGHKTATHFLKKSGGKDGMEVDPAVVRRDSDLGQAYLAGMDLAGRYAYAGREHVARHVVRNILSAKIEEEVHNHHNFAWEEEHFGENYLVVRKGATPAFPGQKGFIGGSMGDDAVIIEGVESDVSKDALYSTVHGAGRVMSRTAAKGKFVNETGEDGKTKRVRKPGLVRHDEMMKWLRDRKVELRGGDLDEAPQAYPDGAAEEFFSTHQAKYEKGEGISFAITRKVDGDLIGGVGLDVTKRFRRAEIGYWIAKPFWGHGYATEAGRAVVAYGFGEWSLHKIVGTYLARNPASGCVMRKLGLAQEGLLREHVIKWDRFEDIVTCGILSSDLLKV